MGTKVDFNSLCENMSQVNLSFKKLDSQHDQLKITQQKNSQK